MCQPNRDYGRLTVEQSHQSRMRSLSSICSEYRSHQSTALKTVDSHCRFENCKTHLPESERCAGKATMTPPGCIVDSLFDSWYTQCGLPRFGACPPFGLVWMESAAFHLTYHINISIWGWPSGQQGRTDDPSMKLSHGIEYPKQKSTHMTLFPSIHSWRSRNSLPISNIRKLRRSLIRFQPSLFATQLRSNLHSTPSLARASLILSTMHQKIANGSPIHTHTWKAQHQYRGRAP